MSSVRIPPLTDSAHPSSEPTSSSRYEIWWKTLVIGVVLGIILTVTIWYYWKDEPIVENAGLDHLTYIKDMQYRHNQREGLC